VAAARSPSFTPFPPSVTHVRQRHNSHPRVAPSSDGRPRRDVARTVV
jgi:hypothetical protein